MSQTSPVNTRLPSKSRIQITTGTAAYYSANSVQVRMSVWDFFLVFGIMSQETTDEVQIKNFQGASTSVLMQAKALCNVLAHNLAQYEQTFERLALEPQFAQPGTPIH